MMKVNGSVVLIELHQPQHRPPFNRFGSLADKPRCPDHVRFATTENVGRVESALCWYPQSGYARQTTRSALACGAGDTYSLADVAVTPYVNRAAMLKMEGLWSKRPGVEAWLARMRERTSSNEQLTNLSLITSGTFSIFRLAKCGSKQSQSWKRTSRRWTSNQTVGT